jgi:hypothetical protein
VVDDSFRDRGCHTFDERGTAPVMAKDTAFIS